MVLVKTNPDRYSRQILYPGIGSKGQCAIGESHIALAGCGATGAAAAGLLARAGVGRLTIIDRDFVEESNLQRQSLFDEEDARLSLPKAEAAKRKIRALNRDVTVHSHVADLTPSNIHELIGDAAILLDCTDNFETRYLINDFAIERQKPWIYAAAVGAYAAGMNILPGETACLACLFPSPPEGALVTCETAGILNAAVHFAAAIQVAEALKFLVGDRDSMRRTFLARDLWTNEQSEISAAAPRTDCPTCGRRDFPHLRGEGRAEITLCGRNSVQIHEHHRPIDFDQMRRRLEPHGTVQCNRLLLRFLYGAYIVNLFADGRAIIEGTTDPGVARSLYARFVGT